MRVRKLMTAFVAAGIGAAGWSAAAAERPVANGLTFLGEAVTSEQIDVGQAIYQDHCASCHGVRLEGEPDWRRRKASGRMPAPPHDATGHTWHHSDQELFTFTKSGLGAVLPDYESDMPAFGGLLTDAEITAVLGFIKSRWPERQRKIQTRITAGGGQSHENNGRLENE